MEGRGIVNESGTDVVMASFKTVVTAAAITSSPPPPPAPPLVGTGSKTTEPRANATSTSAPPPTEADGGETDGLVVMPMAGVTVMAVHKLVTEVSDAMEVILGEMVMGMTAIAVTMTPLADIGVDLRMMTNMTVGMPAPTVAEAIDTAMATVIVIWPPRTELGTNVAGTRLNVTMSIG